MRPAKQFASIRRSLCSIAALSLLFFLVFSAPHRVHHVYEQLPSATAHPTSHGEAHDHSDHNDRSLPDHPGKAKDCLVLAVAQSAHISLASSVELAVFETGTADCAYHIIAE